MLHPVLFVMHRQESEAGAIGQWFRGRGVKFDIRRPRFGDALPHTLTNHCGAVIFGGPMSANDCDSYIKEEIDWIGVSLLEGKPFFGVCLGAQMLAKHLGGVVRPHDRGLTEAGYVKINPAVKPDAVEDVPRHVYHWHREGFSPPSTAEVFAHGDVFENQAFSYRSAIGVQFHPEITLAMIHKWTTRAASRLAAPGAQPRSSHLEGHLKHSAGVRTWLDRTLSGLFEVHIKRKETGEAVPKTLGTVS